MCNLEGHLVVCGEHGLECEGRTTKEVITRDHGNMPIHCVSVGLEVME